MKMTVFWFVASLILVEVYRRFRDACCLHDQGAVMTEASSNHSEGRSFNDALLHECVNFRDNFFGFATQHFDLFYQGILLICAQFKSDSVCNDDPVHINRVGYAQYLKDCCKLMFSVIPIRVVKGMERRDLGTAKSGDELSTPHRHQRCSECIGGISLRWQRYTGSIVTFNEVLTNS
jgi:hypothetical protein